jgi:uncharacterized surface protein with fasciclin (FAS1) repeats
MRRLFLTAMLALGMTGLLAGCWGDDDDEKTIAQVVAEDPNFQTLEDALAAAGLTATFEDRSASYTVFAPTNDAFALMLTELGLTAEELFADVPLLTTVLTYHVLSGEVPAASVPLGAPIEPLLNDSVANSFFKIDSIDGALVFQDGRNRTGTVTSTDIFAANGVIHVLDRVMLPADADIVATAIAANPEFTTLVEALGAADLVATLQGPGPFTVFAPTNAAFEALFVELGVTKEELFADVPLLTSVLLYHVVPSRVLAAEVPIDTPVATVETGTFVVNSDLVITDESNRQSNIVGVDIFTTNGVIHTVDTVLLPALE